MVTLAAMGQVLVFRMVEDQILYAQAGRRLTGVFDGRMVFFIGMEDIRFGIEAESFVKEPFTVADIDFFPGWYGSSPQQVSLPSASAREKPNCLAFVERISKKVTSWPMSWRVSPSATVTRCRRSSRKALSFEDSRFFPIVRSKEMTSS